MLGGEIIKKKSTSQSKENVSSCDPLSLGSTCVDICNFISEELNQNLTEECELLCYRMVGGDYGTVTVPLSSNYFFLKEKVDIWVTKTDVIEFLRGACANVSLIHVYIMFLIENYLSLFQISGIKFLCPQRICDAEIRRDFVAPSLYVKHAFMGEANKEQMTKFVLAPYLQENHWVLLVVDIKRGEAYEFDPLAVKPFKNRRWLNCNNVLSNSYKFYRASLKGPPLSKGRRELTFLPMECAQQTGGTECGYYVMRYMYEIVTKHNECKGNLQEEYIGRTKAYNSEEIDEVREQWAKFFRNKFSLE